MFSMQYIDIFYVFTFGLVLLVSLKFIKSFSLPKNLKTNPENNVYVIETIEKCDEICELLLKSLTLQALGFDAEWITENKTRRPVALVQLSTFDHCGLFRLNILKSIPASLQQILEDENILKVGIVPESDSSYMFRDYGVLTKNTLDLRHLYKFNSGLSDLAHKVLNKTLTKSYEVRCGNWEQTSLSAKQIKYASQDAITAFELFKFYSDNNDDVLLESIVTTYVNQKYTKKAINYTKGVQPLKKNKINRTTPTKERPICRLLAPDNTMLAWVLKRRGLWYVQINQGIVVCEDPFTVRLLFETKYKPNEDERLYEKEEILHRCVVCGSSNNLLRHHIVPRTFKVHYPPAEKTHYSHDIQFVCYRCKTLGEAGNQLLKDYLKKIINYKEDKSFVNFKLAQVRAKALLKFEKVMPSEKAKELQTFILENTNLKFINTENLKELLNENHSTETNRLSAAIVNYYMSDNRSVSDLTKICRQYFISNFKPQFLPKHWSIDYRNN